MGVRRRCADIGVRWPVRGEVAVRARDGTLTAGRAAPDPQTGGDCEPRSPSTRSLCSGSRRRELVAAVTAARLGAGAAAEQVTGSTTRPSAPARTAWAEGMEWWREARARAGKAAGLMERSAPLGRRRLPGRGDDSRFAGGPAGGAKAKRGLAVAGSEIDVLTNCLLLCREPLASRFPAAL